MQKPVALAANNSKLFAGLMSGTSLDGIDAVLASFPDSPSSQKPVLVASHSTSFPIDVKKRILGLCRPDADEVSRMAELDIELGELFADAITEMLRKSGHCASEITAIGCHGQTIRHHSIASNRRFSLQIGDPNTIAFQTGITTVADFRRMDIAALGQGAPLVPAFHDAVLRHPNENRVVINIGGMANLTLLARNEPVIGFDTGPGNVLMDAWIDKHHNQPWDKNGEWAARGRLIPSLLETWLEHHFFLQEAPKSTGRETFNLEWVEHSLETSCAHDPADIQRTLLELTARTITDSVQRLPVTINRVLLCGGGSHNSLLKQRIADLLPATRVDSTDVEGVDPDWLEAMAFAWLAKQRIENKPGNVSTVTGATAPCILGGVYEPPKKILKQD